VSGSASPSASAPGSESVKVMSKAAVPVVSDAAAPNPNPEDASIWSRYSPGGRVPLLVRLLSA